MSIEIRSARPEDIDAISAVIAEALDPEDADEARLVLGDPSFDPDRWLVGTVDGDIASTLALFDGRLRVGAAELPAGQIEFVATVEEARGRGLVRAQMEEAHRRSDAAGHAAVFIVGIPHFYRQFGYSYAVRQPAYVTVDEATPLDTGAGWVVRPATADDVPAILAAQDVVQGEATVALSHNEEMWHWLLKSPNYQVVVTEGRGQFGMARVYEDGETAWMCDVVAPAKGALHALIAHARTVEPEVTVVHRHAGMLSSMLQNVGELEDELGWYYVRIGDPRVMLDGMRTELERRLAESPLYGYTGDLTLSLYGSSVTCRLDDGAVGSIEVGDPIPYPVSAGASGVPADLIADLVLGPHGAAELERLHGDVLLGDQRSLMTVLFPPQIPDIQTWVIP